MQCPAAASAAGKIDDTVLFIFGVIGETAGAFMERLFAQISRTALLDDIALNDNDVIFFIEVYHF